MSTEKVTLIAAPVVAEAPDSVDVVVIPEAAGATVEHDEAFFLKHFGISMEDAQQPVSRGKHSGTFGQMIMDARCPVGKMLRTAFEEGGNEAVDEKIVLLKLLDPEFSVTITRNPREGTEKNLSTADVVKNNTLVDSKPDPKKKIIEKLVTEAAVHARALQQNIRQAVAAQSKVLHRPEVSPKKQTAEASKSPASKKPAQIKPKFPHAESRKIKTKPKLEASAELTSEKLTYKSMAETKLPKVRTFIHERVERDEEIAQIEPADDALVAFNLLKPETDGVEVTFETDLPIYNQSEMMDETETIEFQPLETELLANAITDTEFQQTLPDALTDTELEAYDADGLMAELPFLAFDQPDDLIENENVEALKQPVLSKQIAKYIETIEPNKSEEATAILEIVLKKIESMHIPSEDGKEVVDKADMQQELEILCTRLLKCMGEKPTKARVAYLIQTLMSEYDQGTHERKQDFKQNMTDWTKRIDYSLTNIIGRYTLQLTAPSSFAYP